MQHLLAPDRTWRAPQFHCQLIFNNFLESPGDWHTFCIVRGKQIRQPEEGNEMIKQTNKAGASRIAGAMSAEAVNAGKRVSAREIQIPELYRRPMADRGFQGCLKARA